MKKITLGLLAFFISCCIWQLNAQYMLDQAGTFAPIDISATGTNVTLGDDAVVANLPIGFTFNFYGNDYTDFDIISNGLISFDGNGDNGCCSGEVLPNTSAFEPINFIAFAWEDLDPGNGGQPSANVVRYATVGAPGSQILVMEYFNVDHWPSGDRVTAQVHLFEGSNDIEIHTTTQPATTGNHTMGIQNVDGSMALAVPGRNGQTWTASNDYVRFFIPGPPSGPITECGNAPEPIPATGPSGPMNPSIASVSETGVIGTDYAIENVELDITHTWAGDLNITLVSPSGTTLDLSSGNGGSGNNYTNTVFMDGNPSITTGSPPFTGTFQPEGGTLNGTFDGEPVNGNWTLNILDTASGDNGTLNSYCINFADLNAPDPNAPLMNCPGDITLDANPGECEAPFGFATPPAIDPGGGNVTVVQTMGPASPGPFPVGETIVEFTATNDDAPNEVTTCQFTVTVVDNQAPTLTCPDDITQTNDIGLCGADVTVPAPVIDDNCPTPNTDIAGFSFLGTSNGNNYFLSDGAFTAPNAYNDAAANGGHVVTMADATENEFVRNAIEVLVGDQRVIIGLNDVAVEGTFVWYNGEPVTYTNWSAGEPNNGGGGEDYVEMFGNGLWNDLNGTTAHPYVLEVAAAGVLTNDYNGTDDASDFYPVGTTTVTWTYTDGGGNAASCTMDITVTDDEAPEVVCIGGPMPATGTATATPGLGIPDGDPAGITTTLEITEDFDITDLDLDIDISHTWIGDLTVSLTAPDGVTTAVLIDRPGYTGTGFGCDGTDIVATLDDEAATPVEDECGAGVPSISGSFIPNEALSVFDGMSTLGTWTLFLSDSATPDPGTLNSWSLNYDYNALTSPPLQVFLDVDGQAFVPAPMFVDMVSDNCGIASYEVVGGVAVPPIDECGDNVGAPINNTLPPAESVATVAETGIVGVDYTLDNVNIEITHTWTGDLDIELTSPAGTTLLLSGGNGSSGDNYTGTIFMDGAPSITTGSAPFTGTFSPEGGTFAATFDGEEVNGDWTLSVTDNVGGDNGTLDEYCLDFIPINPSQALFTCDDVGETTVDIIVTDTGGNTATCTAAVTVIDNIDPMLVCQDFTLELGPDGTAMLDPMDLINMDLTVEACGISVDAVSMDDFSCDDIGTPQVVTLFVSDPSGNLASCEATVTVVDLLGPEVTCPADMTVDPGANNQLYEVPDYFADGLASATDNCTDPVTVFAQEPVAGSFIGDGVYTVTLSATDEYGNVGTCTFELTVESILGVEDSALDTGLVLYPNPAQDQVILSNATNILLEKATMFDVNGKLVNTIDLSGMQGEQAIDISKLASGVYIVQIEAENASVVKRLIKE